MDHGDLVDPKRHGLRRILVKDPHGTKLRNFKR
uniref:Uncharacterized protein n=1 Tax=Microviridae sp. ctNWS1 TaxID=2826733 RepID=A0A8S5N3S0_9VIRU|nr:MAG TPA: hypothetical protein [Microviridae sp. ctNWS1]DAU62180.1 MAG TPA: hypothetical protein [Microviridae sp.]